MSSFAIITLDTTAPVVEFGSAGGTTAGEHFEIAYTSNEPLAGATLIDAAGQRLALDSGSPGVLSVLLPPDVADGWATIEWADDVGNADSAVAVLLTGAVVQPPQTPPPPPGGLPRPDKRPMIRRRKLTARSTIIVTSRSRRREATRTRQHRQVATIVSTTRVRTMSVRKSHELALASRATIRSGLHSGATAAVASETAIRRRDDPTIEAFLLDLL